MGLIRAGHGEDPVATLRERIRHIYDIHKLMAVAEVKDLFGDGFSSMIEAVREDDKKNSEFQGEWMDKRMIDSALFKDPGEVLGKLSKYYDEVFSTLVYGELPVVDDLVASISKISKKIREIEGA